MSGTRSEKPVTIKPRIKLPDAVKTGEVIEIKTLIAHVMETGQRKGAAGQTVPRDIIHSFVARFEGQEVFKATLHPGTAANPYLAFHFRVPGPGEFAFTWTDDAGTTVAENVKLEVVA
jgi:sulfur-oxidizing protein SoxZ